MNTQVCEEALIPGSPSDVCPLVTEPKHFQVWYAFGGASIELRPGGTIKMRWEEHGTFEAIIEDVSPPRQLSFHWLDDPNQSVNIILDSDSLDTTIVRIVESGELENPEQSALAWRNGLRLLAKHAASINSRRLDENL